MDPEQIKTQLVALGWRRVPYENRHGDRVQVFAKFAIGDGTPDLILLPMDTTFSDYDARVKEALARFAKIEGRSLVEAMEAKS